MQRIGIAASKIAKGNVYFYHLSVVVIVFLFSVFIFLICGLSIAVAIFLLSLIADRLLPVDHDKFWLESLKTCMVFLSGVVGIWALVAIIRNIRSDHDKAEDR